MPFWSNHGWGYSSQDSRYRGIGRQIEHKACIPYAEDDHILRQAESLKTGWFHFVLSEKVERNVMAEQSRVMHDYWSASCRLKIAWPMYLLSTGPERLKSANSLRVFDKLRCGVRSFVDDLSLRMNIFTLLASQNWSARPRSSMSKSTRTQLIDYSNFSETWPWTPAETLLPQQERQQSSDDRSRLYFPCLSSLVWKRYLSGCWESGITYS